MNLQPLIPTICPEIIEITAFRIVICSDYTKCESQEPNRCHIVLLYFNCKNERIIEFNPYS